jgi:hypothetical protein
MNIVLHNKYYNTTPIGIMWLIYSHLSDVMKE